MLREVAHRLLLQSLDQEDLVLWLNLGTHHVPRAEDSRKSRAARGGQLTG